MTILLNLTKNLNLLKAEESLHEINRQLEKKDKNREVYTDTNIGNHCIDACTNIGVCAVWHWNDGSKR